MLCFNPKRTPRFLATQQDLHRRGAGLQFHLIQQVALRLQSDRDHFTNAFGAKPNVAAHTFSVKVGFQDKAVEIMGLHRIQADLLSIAAVLGTLALGPW